MRSPCVLSPCPPILHARSIVARAEDVPASLVRQLAVTLFGDDLSGKPPYDPERALHDLGVREVRIGNVPQFCDQLRERYRAILRREQLPALAH